MSACTFDAMAIDEHGDSAFLLPAAGPQATETGINVGFHNRFEPGYNSLNA